jgi:hypothetical protein
MRASAVMLATSSRFERDWIEPTCTGWKSIINSAALCGVSRWSVRGSRMVLNDVTQCPYLCDGAGVET